MMSRQSTEPQKHSAILTGLLVFISVLVGLAGFGGALLELVRRWNAQEEYSHGFLIPLVVMWLLWSRRDAFVASIDRPSWSGPVLILLAMLLHVTGELSAIFIFSQFAFVMALLGIILGVGGFPILRVTTSQ